MKKAKEGYVYVLECGGFYKIGSTSNIRGITQRYKTENPFPIKRVCQWKTTNAYSLEAYLHELFADVRHQGEWFTLSPDLGFFRIKLEGNKWGTKKVLMNEVIDLLEECIAKKVYGV